MKYYPEHKKKRSPLLDLHNFICISQIPLDYMHFILQGVLKQMLNFLMKGPKYCRISNAQINEISDRLVSFAGLMLSEFNRQPRSLSDINYWKATEFRQLLLYTGPLVFKSVLSKEFYQHFLALHVAISILLNKSMIKRSEMLIYAENLLKWFVGRAKKLYGETFTVYNVHNITHLVNDVRTHKVTLNDISAFKFENHLQVYKKLIKNDKTPAVQFRKDKQNENITVLRPKRQKLLKYPKATKIPIHQ